MNSHLAHLLSCVFDGLLAPEHRADLAKSGLTDATIAAQFIRTVPPSMIPKLLGFNVLAMRSAPLFPFRSAAGGFMDLPRVKVFPPLRDHDGHQVKYLQPRGSSSRVYFVGAVLERVLTSDEPLWICEGEKKRVPSRNSASPPSASVASRAGTQAARSTCSQTSTRSGWRAVLLRSCPTATTSTT